MLEREGDSDLETQFFALKDSIVTKLDERFQARTDNVGGLFTRMVSNEKDGGGQALVIDNKGKWSGKMDMMGWDIGQDPSIDTLLGYYAGIKDQEYQKIERQAFQASSDYYQGADPRVSEVMDRRIKARGENEEVQITEDEQVLLDEFHRGHEALDQEWDEKKRTYIAEHKARLIQGFISSMEETLKQF